MTEIEPQNRPLGYARVSTYGQTLDAQLEQLRAAGCTSRNIYREKVTGPRADRRELLKMLKALAPGDIVTVTRIDRLARSTFDLFAIVKQIVDAGAQFRSLEFAPRRYRRDDQRLADLRMHGEPHHAFGASERRFDGFCAVRAPSGGRGMPENAMNYDGPIDKIGSPEQIAEEIGRLLTQPAIEP
jgi:hypothetical protein